jgi:hypothetical protein
MERIFRRRQLVERLQGFGFSWSDVEAMEHTFRRVSAFDFSSRIADLSTLRDLGFGGLLRLLLNSLPFGLLRLDPALSILGYLGWGLGILPSNSKGHRQS